MDTKKILSSAIYFILGMNILFADDIEAWNKGKDFGSNVNSYYRGNMKEELVTPMTSDKSFKTMDGNKTFNANMTCGESSKSFMTVSYTLGSPKNGAVAVVKIDRDLDGTKEYSFTSPYTASAVCTNGIAVCNGGDFSGGTCSYYKWNYNGATLSLSQTQQNLISGCTCINDTCGSIASSSKDVVSNKLASGIYGVMSSYSANYIVSQTTITNGIAEYFGQKTDNCTNYKGTVISSGTSTTIDSSAEVLSQSADGNSSYSALLGTSSNYSTNSPKIDANVSSTVTTNSKMRSSVYNKDGTTDFTTNDASGKNLPGHVGIPLEDLSEEYCQVTWLGKSTAMFTDNTERTTSTTSGEQWQVETRKCTNHICPYQASKGEKIKHPCGKIDNFSEATSALAAVKELADDITCGSL